MPGLFAILCFYHKSEKVIPDLNVARYLLIATIFCLFVHAFANIVSAVLFHRVADLASVIGLAAGQNGIATTVAQNVYDNFWRILLYMFLTIYLSGLVGSYLGIWVTSRKPAEIFINEGDVWTFLDVIVEGEALYRGIYHSHRTPQEMGPDSAKSTKGIFGGYLGLAIASRFKRKTEVTSTAQHSWRPIRGTVSLEEVAGIVHSSMKTTYGEEEATKRASDWIRQGPEAFYKEIEDYISYRVKKGKPQFIIPWNEIKNINVRFFQVGEIVEQDVQIHSLLERSRAFARKWLLPL